MIMRCGVFSCRGLGDGLIALVLSHNLKINGHRVETFHPFLSGLQEWFPSLILRPFPAVSELDTFDRFFIIYEKTEWMAKVLEFALSRYPERTVVLNPIATRNRNYPYWNKENLMGLILLWIIFIGIVRSSSNCRLLPKAMGLCDQKGLHTEVMREES